MKLLFDAVVKFIVGILLVAALIFLPAGTLYYPQGLLFSAVLFIPILIMGIVLFVRAPELLKKRLNNREKENTQKGVVAASGLIFIIGFILAGLDFRFGWTKLPLAVTIAAIILFLFSYILLAFVMRQNEYLSRTIEVQENQRVVDTGLYGVVRHPMYMATIIMFLCMPLILGSLASFIIFLAYPIVISLRIKNEEQVLSGQLEGYTEYKQKVKYKIIPFVW